MKLNVQVCFQILVVLWKFRTQKEAGCEDGLLILVCICIYAYNYKGENQLKKACRSSKDVV